MKCIRKPYTNVEREWFDAALELDAENRELRRILTQLVLWLATTDELSELARATIDRRWPNLRAAA